MKITCEDYSIYLNDTESLVAFCNQKEYSSYLVLVDENTKLHCLPLLEGMLPHIKLNVISIVSGEKNKSIASCTDIWNQMLKIGADRHSLCLNLGGGVIGDMGGFCASTFMRGMDFIQIPTTLLSMVDASVGGKLGIDFKNQKNYIGLFKNPNGVFVFTTFLKTLSTRELQSGFAEVLKHGLIRDTSYWEEVSRIDDLGKAEWSSIILRSIIIKNDVVTLDPKEKGLRKVLNFGHTIGHALESYFLKSENPLLHGEAVALGMICESHISLQKELISPSTFQEIKNCISHLYKYVLPIKVDADRILDLCKGDKKNVNQEYRFSLLNSIGGGSFDHNVHASEIVHSLKEIT